MITSELIKKIITLLLCIAVECVMLACNNDPLLLDEDNNNIWEDTTNQYTQSDSCEAEVDTWDVSLFADNGYSNQSAASYGKYAFLVTDYLSSISFYNLAERKMIKRLTLPKHAEKIYGSTLYHCNQSSFSNFFYDEHDKFPLLYISQRNDSLLRCFMEVYRFVINNGNWTSFNALPVQRVYLPPMTKENALGNANMVIDQETGNVYTYSRNNVRKDANYNVCRITQWYIPKTLDKEVYLDESNVIDSYEIGCSAYAMQGACIHNGKLYIGQGFRNQGKLRIVSLTERRLVETIDLVKLGYLLEPEGCFWYNGELLISSGVNIHQITNNKAIL